MLRYRRTGPFLLLLLSGAMEGEATKEKLFKKGPSGGEEVFAMFPRQGAWCASSPAGGKNKKRGEEAMRSLIKTWKGQKKVFSPQAWEEICRVIPTLRGKVFADLEVGGEQVTLRVVYCSDKIIVWTE